MEKQHRLDFSLALRAAAMHGSARRSTAGWGSRPTADSHHWRQGRNLDNRGNPPPFGEVNSPQR